MKKIISLLLLIIPFLAEAKWTTHYNSQGKPVETEMTVERTTNRSRYKIQYIYNYADSTFIVRVFPTAEMLMAVQEISHRRPARPSYVEHNFRFKGGSKGKQFLSYKNYDTNPDIDVMVGKGILESSIKDDGRILQNLRDSKKMELQYWSWHHWGRASTELDTSDFEKNASSHIGKINP